MTAEHFDGLLNGLRKSQPFQIFTIELTTGRRFEIDHPDALIARYGVAVFMAPGGIPIWFDHESVSLVEAAMAGEQSA